jgi:hypothetical protein
MTLQITFNLNFTGEPPTWLVPLIESVITPLFTAPVSGIDVDINVGGSIPTPAQTAAMQTLLKGIKSADESLASVVH